MSFCARKSLETSGLLYIRGVLLVLRLGIDIMAPAYLLKYHPLITPRIEFKPAPPPPLPKLTQRTEFHAEELLRSRKRYEEDQDNPARGPKRRRVSFAPDDVDHEDSGNPPSASASAPRKLIPKPPGEPGRPSSGGFSLEETLVDCHGWQKSKFDDLHVRARIHDKTYISNVSPIETR